MNVKDTKGSVTVFVLVGLLFMTSFLIISFASNVNKSKVAKEQINVMSDIYSHKDGNINAYERAYTALRKKKAQTLTEQVENSNTLELTKTFEGNLSNYKIYGNSSNVGDLVSDTTDANYGKYKIPVKVTGKNLFEKSLIINSSNVIYNNGVATQIQGDTSTNMNFRVQTFNNGIYVQDLQVKTITETGKVFFNITKANTFNQIVFGLSGSARNTEINVDISDLEDNKTYTLSFKVLNLTQGSVSWSNIQIEEGNVATEYSEEPILVDIYLNQPLTKVGDISDYIDFKSGKITRNDNTEENIIVPQLKTFEDYTKIEVLTSVNPSKIEAEYLGYKFE